MVQKAQDEEFGLTKKAKNKKKVVQKAKKEAFGPIKKTKIAKKMVQKAKKEVFGRYMNNNEAYSIFNRKIKPNCPSVEVTKNTIKKFVEGLEIEERNYYKSTQLEQYHNENALKLLEKEFDLTKEEVIPMLTDVVETFRKG